MQKLILQNKIKHLVVFLFVAALAFTVYLLPQTVSAETYVSTYNHADTPFPRIHLPCDETEDPEFASLRPYQAAACGDANKAYFCSNSLVFVETFEDFPQCKAQAPAEGKFICDLGSGKFIEDHNLIVDLDESELPILGNTELTKNSQSNSDSIDDGTKMNEYVSWYLEGTLNRAEYGENDVSKVVDYSGPIQKIMPGVMLDAQRLSSIDQVETKVAQVDDEELTTGKTEPANHDQIVVCGKEGEGGFLGWIQDIFNVGRTTAIPCYDGGGGAKGDVYRLTTWNEDLSAFNLATNVVVKGALQGLKIIYPFIPSGALEESLGKHWNSRRPPLPWDDGTGKPFPRSVDYQKAYYEWRGQTCVIIPIINRLACFENILVPNKYADLFPYIPLANTVDKRGAVKDFIAVIQPIGQTEIVDKSYDYPISAPMWFAHTQEVKDLSEFLNKSYTPQGLKGGSVTDTEKNDCQIVKVRTNSGDKLFPGQPHGIIVPNVHYTITQVPCEVKLEEKCNNDNHPNVCAGGAGACCFTKQLKCDAEISIKLPTITATPWAEEIWQATVANSASTFRRIFPKTGENAPVSCIADLPASTKVKYIPTDPVGNGDDNFYVEDPNGHKTETPTLLFPHLGSVYDYFLKGIQTALRPKGFGEGQVESGQTCTNIVCGELPETLPKGSGSCKLGGVSSRVGDIPESLKDIVSAAAETYKVPPNLILGVMFGEGAFNTDSAGRYSRYNWTDQNVKNWATCQRLPNCAIGDTITSVVPFIKVYWDKNAQKILPDLKKIDPSKKEADPCNLLDAIYGIAVDLHTNAAGSPAFQGKSCFGIPLNYGNTAAPLSCSWGSDSLYESAIRIWEFGTAYDSTYGCATKENSCATGGAGSNCPSGGDTCETKDNRYSSPSHNACVYDVAHGN